MNAIAVSGQHSPCHIDGSNSSHFPKASYNTSEDKFRIAIAITIEGKPAQITVWETYEQDIGLSVSE